MMSGSGDSGQGDTARASRRRRRPSLRTIAEYLGMSVTTVSRALGDGERISAETIRKVKETADQLGYVRNLDGVKLRTGRTLVVYALLATLPEEEVGDTSSISLLYGIHERFAGTDYSVRAVPLRSLSDAMPALEEIVNGHLADGVIIDHTEVDDERVAYLQKVGLPFVTFGRTNAQKPYAYFDIDNEYAAWQSTEALLRKGFRRVGLIDPTLGFAFARQRLEGYRRALHDHGVAYDEGLVRRIALKAEASRQSARELIQMGATGLVCVNEIVMFGAMAAAHDLGAEVGRDVGIATHMGTNIAAYLSTPLIGSFYSRTGAGRSLADFLLRRMEGEPIEALQMISRPELREYGNV